MSNEGCLVKLTDLSLESLTLAKSIFLSQNLPLPINRLSIIDD